MVPQLIFLLWIAINWLLEKMKETLGRYKIMKEIGRGAMGVVYQGYDPKIDRIVALKTIRKDRLAESRGAEDLVTRFQREIRAMGKLVHPNIIVIYDTGEDEETAYVAMEFVEGDTLENLIQKGIRFSTEKIIDIMDKICDGLEYTHRQGIVHRDLKPSNIMLLKGDRVKITDFGISKAVGASSSSMTQAGIFLGTPSYMSPEQIAGRKLDGRSDLFSLGIVLYQLLTGEKPFFANTISTLMYNIVNREPIPPSQIDSSIPSHYDKVIAKALAKDADKRYQTAKDFIEDLKRAYRGECLVEASSIEPTMTVVPGMLDKIYPKRKRFRLLAGFVVLFLVLILGGYYWMHKTPRVPKEEEGFVAAPKPIKAFGRIVVTSDPPSAQVFLNGKEFGVLTPAVIEKVRAGKKYEIRVEKEGFKPWVGIVELEPHKSVPIEVSLARLVGSIIVRSTPPDAQIFLDGERIEALTPAVIERVPAGEKHKIRVEKEGFKAWSEIVEPEPDKSLTIEASLARLAGTVVVRSDPPGASVLVDGERHKDATPTEIKNVTVGEKHKIRVEKEGFRAWSEIVEPEPDKSLTIEASLTRVVPKLPLTGEIRISSKPSGAKVSLNGNHMGRVTPSLLSGLSPGTYTVNLEKEGYKAWEKEVVVRASETSDLSEAELQMAFGKLNLSSSPWVDVYHAGKKMGTTPLAEIRFQEGAHRLVLRNPLLNIEKTITVKIVADKTEKMSIDMMEGIRGQLKINVHPWAYVYVDGKNMGSTPLNPLELTVGEHTVLVENEKLGKKRSFRITIKANEMVSKNVNLLEKE
jgi:tRNA A-37 threonylcarbamoyl transferase component Bud32